VRGVGLAHPKGLPKLRYLHLYKTKVSDAGLAHLKGLTNLQDLDLGHTKVSAGGRPT
jgi:hypothetical protein